MTIRISSNDDKLIKVTTVTETLMMPDNCSIGITDNINNSSNDNNDNGDGLGHNEIMSNNDGDDNEDKDETSDICNYLF